MVVAWDSAATGGVSPLPFALAHLLVALPQHGEVLKRDGKRVRVDLSHSGGPKSKWTTLDDICRVRAPTEKKTKPKKVRANSCCWHRRRTAPSRLIRSVSI